MRYLLFILILPVQLFSYDTNTTITLYGTVNEQLVKSSITNKKEPHYILQSYYQDKKKIDNKPLELIFDKNITKITIPKNRSFQRFRLQGSILDIEHKYLTPQIFKISSLRETEEKIRVASFLNNYTKVKFYIDSPMLGEVDAKHKNRAVDYISNIKVKADNTLVYNVNLSPCISKNPILKFAYKDLKANLLTLEYTENNATIGIKTKKVKHRNRINPMPKKIELLKNPKTYSNQIKSIKKLFGNITLIEDGIEIRASKLASNGGRIPISIRSDIKFKSVALFIGFTNDNFYNKPYQINNSDISCGEANGYSLAAQWFSTHYSLADFNLSIKMRYSGEVLVVLEATNGKFYTMKKQIELWRGGENCS